MLEVFARREGHCNIPRNYKTENGNLLGSWLGNQRLQKHSMPRDRITKLESIPGWTWNVKDSAWDAMFIYLNEFAKEEGHCKVPAKYITRDGQRLGTWVVTQRATQDSMPIQRKEKLEAVPGWLWQVRG
jgi:hypothetical protein